MAAPELYRLNLPALSSLEEPKTNGVLVLQLVILEILDFMGQEWTPNQITECSELSYQEYYWFTIGELKQFAMRLKTGYFGKIYGKFAPAHLMEFLKDYSDEMFEARADYFGKAKLQQTPEQSAPLTEEEKRRQDHFFKHLVDLAKKLSAKSSEELTQEDIARDQRMKKHMEFFQANLTPEQKAEIEQRRLEIQIAAKEYEEGKR